MGDATITAIIALIGVILGAAMNYSFESKRKVKEAEQILKETRYKAILLLAYARAHPKTLNTIIMPHRPDLATIERLDEELHAEFRNMLLFASDCVIKKFKQFLITPSEKTFLQVVLCMRRDLFNKKTNLRYEDIK